jgi:hypothetical protein
LYFGWLILSKRPHWLANKCYKDDEDYQLLVIKPAKYLNVLAQGWIIKGFLRFSPKPPPPIVKWLLDAQESR